MEFTQFVRKPFTVEAVEITADNIAEVAKLVGEVKTKNDVTFIQLDRRIVPNVNRAYIGWFMTRLGDNYRCYSTKVFNEQFQDHQPTITFVFEDLQDEFDQTPPSGPVPNPYPEVEDANAVGVV